MEDINSVLQLNETIMDQVPGDEYIEQYPYHSDHRRSLLLAGAGAPATLCTASGSSTRNSAVVREVQVKGDLHPLEDPLEDPLEVRGRRDAWLVDVR
eukprot:gene15845-18793_t